MVKSQEEKYIKRRNKMLRGHLPDFLIIGPQRTGTTWLSENLRKHPDFLISFPKELYYFSRLQHNAGSKFAENFRKQKMKQSFRNYLVSLSEYVYFDFYKTGRYRPNELEWYSSFFTMNILERVLKNISTLIKYGTFYNPKFRGEATASYLNLDDNVIEELTDILPNSKFIIIIRDPVERAWSHAKKYVARNLFREISTISSEEMKAFFTSDYQMACGMYIQNIQKWSKYVKPENLLIASFNKLNDDPKDFLTEVLQFLGAEPSLRYFGDDVHKKVNKTKALIIPENYRNFLNELFHDEIIRIHQQYGADFI